MSSQGTSRTGLAATAAISIPVAMLVVFGITVVVIDNIRDAQQWEWPLTPLILGAGLLSLPINGFIVRRIDPDLPRSGWLILLGVGAVVGTGLGVGLLALVLLQLAVPGAFV